MSIALSDARPVAAPLPAAVTTASVDLPATPGSSDDSAFEGTPFDAALLACLAVQADPQTVAADTPPADAARPDGEDSAAPTATDDTLTAPLQGMPAMLTALLPPAQVAAAAQSPATPEPAAARTSATRAGTSAGPASWPATGEAGSGPAIALMLAAGQGGLRPLQATTRSEPVAVPADAAQSATPSAFGMPAGGTPLPERTAAMAGSTAGEGAHVLPTDGADSSVPAPVLSAGIADAGTPRSPDAPLRLPNGDASQWRQPLAQALGERLQFASERGIDSAVIRLEPPRMGSIEIAIRHQDGALQVNLSATHNEVLRQLQDISDSLRHGLGQRHAGEVTVQVAADSASPRPGQGDSERQRQRQAQSEQNPGRALGDDEADDGTASFRLARNEE
jgi:flagellar hook-length control protein FliK